MPHDAVNPGPAGSYVWVVDKTSTAKIENVTVLTDDGNESAVKGNVKPGDRVITDGQLRVIPGAKVSIAKNLTAKHNPEQAPAGAQ